MIASNGSWYRRVSGWWLNRSVRAKGLAVVAVPMLALLAVTGSGLVLQVQQHGERQAALAANALVRASQMVLSDAVDAETAMRGYANTADVVFLHPYTTAADGRDADIAAQVRAARTSTEHANAQTVATTFTAVLTGLAELRAAIAAGARGAELAGMFSAGKTAMDRLRAQTAELAAQPAAVTVQKRESISRLEQQIQTVQLTGLVLGLLAGLAGIGLFTSGIARRVRIAADNAHRLGSGAALLPTPTSSDELGRLGASLQRSHRVLSARHSELAAARDQALRANRTKNTFLSRTSHELRTPLNAILGFAQLLEMSELSSEDRDSTARILKGGRHLLSLINELIDIARVESGDLRLSVEPVPVNGAASEVAALIGPLADARGITVRLQPAEQHLATYADHLRLRQVLLNLASNAVKYNHHGGMIEINCRLAQPEHVEVAVADTGPGLSAEEIERIFVPFERLDADQHGIEGTGIGLPLALALTEAMGGTLTVSSVPGHGSTFTVRLPRAPNVGEPIGVTSPAGAAHLATAPTRTPEPGSDSLTVVVLSIEDNTANTALLERMIGHWPGIRLHTAATALAGIELAQRHRPDLILLDLHLPDLPGEEAYARLRAEPATAQVPIVVLSADATPGTIRRLLARGAAAYLTKPLDLQELRTVLDALVPTRPFAGRTNSS